MSIQMRDVVGLDVETYSGRNLPVVGVQNYVDSPDFKILLAAVSRTAMDPDGEADGVEVMVIDFVADEEGAMHALRHLLEDKFIVAHNAMFEYAVLQRIGIHLSPDVFVDSAVLARTAGLGGSLEAAAPQGLGVDKLPSGKLGIQTFCIPGTYQMENGDDAFDPKVVADNPDMWDEFKEYNAMDAALSLQLALALSIAADENELIYSSNTLRMNTVGWKVDVALVEEMQRRYLENVAGEEQRFRDDCDAPTLNLASHKQLVEWCLERGVKASSFDEASVAKLLSKVEKKIMQTDDDDPRLEGYAQVMHLLRTKQALGGSSLKKLQTILDKVGEDGRLKDQYLHCGASTTLRTTGRGVQLQNLKRLNGRPDPVEALFDPAVHWDNHRLAGNLRQVFTATDPAGVLIVGDYKAVESRGLAWFAGEDWKLDTYRQGLGVYEMQASRFFDVAYDSVSKEQRMFGKVGELSCGYQAGSEAVQGFAEKMGVPLTYGEAAKLVKDFRTANPATVAFWAALQAALEEVSEMGMATVALPHGQLHFHTITSLDSLIHQESDALKTLIVKLKVPEADFLMTRMFHGFHRNGREFNYWKPSERKTGDLWVPSYTDPKTGQTRRYSLYGGKLAGILTQSLCREIFMDGVASMYTWLRPVSNVEIVGQFHDEMVLDWATPATVLDPDLMDTVARLEKVMSYTRLPGFPLAADVKWDYRYTK